MQLIIVTEYLIIQLNYPNSTYFIAFSTFLMLCSNHLYLVPRPFCGPQRKSHTHEPVITHFPSLKTLETISLFYISMDLPLLEVLYKWTPTTCDVLWLCSLSMFFEAHSHCSIAPLPYMKNISLYEYTHIVYLFITWWAFHLM